MDAAPLLAALRDSTLQRDWNGCRAALSELLSALEPAVALRVARDEVRQRLPVFARQQPDAIWPYEILARLETSPDVASCEPPVEEYEGPGVNSFCKAMEALLAAHRHSIDAGALAANATDAIAEAIMAGMTEQWGARHRDRWDRWYHEAQSGEPAEEPDVLLAMMNDPDVAALERQSWMAVAEAIERAA